jgi:hypothetical protein
VGVGVVVGGGGGGAKTGVPNAWVLLEWNAKATPLSLKLKGLYDNGTAVVTHGALR